MIFWDLNEDKQKIAIELIKKYITPAWKTESEVLEVAKKAHYFPNETVVIKSDEFE